MLEAGQTPVITSDVNSELLGGMTVSLGDMYTDMKDMIKYFVQEFDLLNLSK